VIAAPQIDPLKGRLAAQAVDQNRNSTCFYHVAGVLEAPGVVQ